MALYFFHLTDSNTLSSSLTLGSKVQKTGAFGVTTCSLISCAVSGFADLHGQGKYRGMSNSAILWPVSLTMLVDVGRKTRSGAASMKRWPRGHSYSTPIKTFTVIWGVEPGGRTRRPLVACLFIWGETVFFFFMGLKGYSLNPFL